MKNLSKILLLLLLAIAVIILWKWACNKPITTPVTTPTETQVQVQVADEVLRQFYADSFFNIIRQKNNLVIKLRIAHDDLMAEYLNYQNDISNTLGRPVPDTCKPIVALLNSQFAKLVATNSKKDSAAKTVITALHILNFEKDNFLNEKERAYSKLKNNFDVCIANAKVNEAYIKKINPKRGIYAGITAISNAATIYSGIGVNIDYMNRNGTSYGVGVIQMGSVIQYTVCIKTRLFKF